MVLVIGIAALYTSVMVVLSRNPVSSVIYLVGTIINGGLIFVMLGINIIPLIYIIVYVGGISILFLFVIMMVDLHQVRSKSKGEIWQEEGGVGYIPAIAVIIPTVLLYKMDMIQRGGYKEGIGLVTGYRKMRWEASTTTLDLIKSMGYMLYSENIMALMIIGLLLLMVMMSLNLLLTVNLSIGVGTETSKTEGENEPKNTIK